MDIEEITFKELLAAIAAKTPTPGGGAVAAVTAAMAAALAQMVVSYSIGKKSLAGHAEIHHGSMRSLQTFGAHATDLAQADAASYTLLNDLLKLNPDDARRRNELPGAVMQAIQPPMDVLSAALDILMTIMTLCGTTNPQLNSDLAMAAILAEAAARSAAINVRINLPLVADQTERDRIAKAVDGRVREALSLLESIQEQCPVGE